MNKKYLYFFLIATLFTVSMVTPVIGASYTFPVPAAAVGQSTETEVVLYDEDAWEDVVGKDMDPTEIWDDDGDTDEQGAKSKSLINKVGDEGEAVLSEIAEDELLKVNESHWACKGIAQILGNAAAVTNLGPIAGSLIASATALGAGVMNFTAIVYKYDKKFDAWIVERDKWLFTDSFDSDPDEEDDEVPFIQDPTDVYALFEGLQTAVSDVIALLTPQLGQAGAILAPPYGVSGYMTQYYLSEMSHPITGLPLINGVPANLTLLGYISGLTSGAGELLPIIGKYMYGDEFLWDALAEGLPASAPIDGWLEEMLDEFLDNDDNWVETKVKDITADGNVIEFEMEGEEDYSVIYTYGDFGTQDSVIVKDKSGDEIYRMEGIGMIPGYEITVLLAVSAISTIGLIYVIKKKRM